MRWMAQKIFLCMINKFFALIGDNQTSPKGINRRGNTEESESLDWENKEITLEEFQKEGIDDGELNEDVKHKENPVMMQ